jgi:hypothetical protein
MPQSPGKPVKQVLGGENNAVEFDPAKNHPARLLA